MAHKPIDMTKAQAAYSGSGPKAQASYTDAVKVGDWATGAGSVQAQANYVTSMSNPQILARRLVGVQKTPNTYWQTQSATYGAPRLNSGIAGAGPKWNTGFAPSKDIIDNFPYKPKTTDAATNYDNNAKALGVALQNAARQRKATGS